MLCCDGTDERGRVCNRDSVWAVHYIVEATRDDPAPWGGSTERATSYACQDHRDQVTDRALEESWRGVATIRKMEDNDDG